MVVKSKNREFKSIRAQHTARDVRRTNAFKSPQRGLRLLVAGEDGPQSWRSVRKQPASCTADSARAFGFAHGDGRAAAMARQGAVHRARTNRARCRPFGRWASPQEVSGCEHSLSVFVSFGVQGCCSPLPAAASPPTFHSHPLAFSAPRYADGGSDALAVAVAVAPPSPAATFEARSSVAVLGTRDTGEPTSTPTGKWSRACVVVACVTPWVRAPACRRVLAPALSLRSRPRLGSGPRWLAEVPLQGCRVTLLVRSVPVRWRKRCITS